MRRSVLTRRLDRLQEVAILKTVETLGRRRIFIYDGPYEGAHPVWGTLASLVFALPGGLALAAAALLPPESPLARLLPEPARSAQMLSIFGAIILLTGLAGFSFCLIQWRRGSKPGSDGQGRLLVRAIVETVVMLAFIVPVNIAPFAGGPGQLAIIAVVMDGFLIWSLARSVKKLRGFLRFGEARLELMGAAVRLGGAVEGRLTLEHNTNQLERIQLTLRRMELGKVRSRDASGDISYEPAFYETHAAQRDFGPAEAPGALTGLRFRFELPAQVEPPEDGFTAQWELLVAGSGGGVDYRSVFLIPFEPPA